jgi:hypothetical protein
MRPPLVEADEHAEAVRVIEGEPAPHVLESRLAGADDREGRIERRKLRCERGKQVEPFLLGHARHHGNHRPRHGGIIHWQTERLEQRAFGRALARQVGRAEGFGQVGIARRIPFGIVDAVENADKRV